MNLQISELIASPVIYSIEKGRIVMNPEEYQKILDLIKVTSNGAVQVDKDEAHVYAIRESSELRIQLSESFLVKGNNYSLPVIMEAVSQYFGIAIETIKSPWRKREVVAARQIYMYIAWHYRIESGTSLVKIARFCGDRDHSTAVHSRNVMECYLSGPAKEQDIVIAVEAIKKKIELQAQTLTLHNLRSVAEDIKRSDQFIYEGSYYEVIRHGADSNAHCRAIENPTKGMITLSYGKLRQLINSLYLAKSNGITGVLILTEAQKKILFRTSGLHKNERISQNRYVAGFNHPLLADLKYLVNTGFMMDTAPIEKFNGSVLYYLTGNGLKAAELLKYIENGGV